MLDPNHTIFPISVASKLVGVHPKTLRLYEKEGLINLERESKKRFYSHNHIKWLRCVRELIHTEKISIPALKRLFKLQACWEISNCPVEIRESCSAYQEQIKWNGISSDNSI